MLLVCLQALQHADAAHASQATEPYLIEHALQLVPGLSNAIAIVAVHHEDQSLCVLEVVPPKWADLHMKQALLAQEGS
jgi:hypothetical protein